MFSASNTNVSWEKRRRSRSNLLREQIPQYLSTNVLNHRQRSSITILYCCHAAEGTERKKAIHCLIPTFSPEQSTTITAPLHSREQRVIIDSSTVTPTRPLLSCRLLNRLLEVVDFDLRRLED